MSDKVIGDFVIVPRVTIKSDEPILLDGMPYDDLKSRFNVPVYDLDTDARATALSCPRTFLTKAGHQFSCRSRRR